MPARRAQKPRSTDVVTPNAVDDPATSRAIDSLAGAVQKLQGQTGYQIVEIDLVVGTNAVQHSLGRPAKVAHVTPSTADASFAYALVRDHGSATKQALIEVIGVDQPGASVLLM